jgi:fermentation-respiration switch protein FrsA (DUF1100 family)
LGGKVRPRHYIRNLCCTALAGSLLGLMILIGVLARMQLNAFLGSSPSTPSQTPADYDLAYEDLTLVAEDGIRLTAWYLPAPAPNGAGLVLVHGRGGNRAALLPTAAILARHGYAALLLDLRAHGQSEGEIVTYGYGESLDVLAGLAYLAQHPDLQPERIGALGVSLGGAAVIRAAARSDVPQVIIVQSTFRDLPAAVEDAFDDMSQLPRWPFAPLIVWLGERRTGLNISDIDLARDIAAIAPRPVFLIHGTEDTLLPLEHHTALYQAAAEPKETWVVEGMGHDSPMDVDPREYECRLIDFLDRYLLGGTTEYPSPNVP